MRVLAALLFASAAFAQQTVQIISDEGQVLVGKTMQFRALVRDAQGNPIQGGAVTWSTNNGTIATIDNNGVLTARFLGAVRVQARSGALFAETVIQTIPSKVEISPSSANLDVGQQTRFSAAAYDANGAVIPGVTFAWSVLNHRLGTSQVVRTDALGNVNAVSEGGAMVLGTYTYGDVQPGMQRQWIVTAPITVQVPKSYELRRIWSRDRTRKNGFELRAKPTMLWPTDDGRIFFNGIFDGQANALAALNIASGQYEFPSVGGETRFAQGSHTIEFRTHSITRSGRVMTWEDTNINGAQINLGDRTGVLNHISNNTPLAPGTEATSALVLNRNSYNDKGFAIVRANFRFELNPTTYNGLFTGVEGRYSDLLVSTQERVPELTGAFTIDGDFGVDGKGTAYYGLTAGAGRAFYKHTPGTSRTKIIAIGDSLLGSTVRNFAGGRGNHPTFWVDEDGTFMLCVTLNDNSIHFLRWLPDGKMESLRVTSQSGILWHHPLHGTLLHANPFNNRGNGVWLWPPTGDARALFRYGVERFDGEVVQDIESGAINTKGEIFVYARGDRTLMLLTQLGLDQPRVLARSGDRIDGNLPVNIVNFIGGARNGPPHVYAGGSSGSIVEFNQGDAFNMLGYGERLFGNNTLWFGAFHGGTWNVRKSPHGETWFSTGSGIARMNSEYKPELMVRFPLRDGALTVNAPTNFDINSRGEILFVSSTSAGDSRFYLLPDAQSTTPKPILNYSATAATATTLDNRIASGFDSFSLNDEGQVLASLRFRNVNVPVFYVYDGTKWTFLAEPNVTRVGPHLVTGIANLHRAGGGRNFGALTIQAGGNILVEVKNNTLEIVVNNSTIMPSGQVTTSVVTQESNRNGDLLFQHSNGGNNFLIVKRGDKMYQVANLFKPTAEGDYLIRINSIDFRDDGTVYFLAGTASDDLVLYQATPLF